MSSVVTFDNAKSGDRKYIAHPRNDPTNIPIKGLKHFNAWAVELFILVVFDIQVIVYLTLKWNI